MKSQGFLNKIVADFAPLIFSVHPTSDKKSERNSEGACQENLLFSETLLSHRSRLGFEIETENDPELSGEIELSEAIEFEYFHHKLKSIAQSVLFLDSF